jgi:hypothetical protein
MIRIKFGLICIWFAELSKTSGVIKFAEYSKDRLLVSHFLREMRKISFSVLHSFCPGLKDIYRLEIARYFDIDYDKILKQRFALHTLEE